MIKLIKLLKLFNWLTDALRCESKAAAIQLTLSLYLSLSGTLSFII